MERKKKITIKHFLNKKLKPVLNSKGENTYPSYTRVTFNRTNTIFFMDWPRFYPSIFEDESSKFSESDFNTFLAKPSTRSCIERTDKFIEKIIRYETEVLDDRFQLSGFRERLEYYDFLLADYIYLNTIEETFDIIKDVATRTQYLLLRQKYYSLDKLKSNTIDKSEDSLPLFEEFKKYIPNDIYEKLLIVFRITFFEAVIGKRINIFDWWVGDARDKIFKFLEKDREEEMKDNLNKKVIPIVDELIKWDVVRLYDY